MATYAAASAAHDAADADAAYVAESAAQADILRHAIYCASTATDMGARIPHAEGRGHI